MTKRYHAISRVWCDIYTTEEMLKMPAAFDPKTTRVVDGLSVSLDYDTDPTEAHPVFLFVPDVKKPDHWHIPIDREEAQSLRDWLDEYLKMDTPARDNA